MKVQGLLDRAMSQVGLKTAYVLGGGRQSPDGRDCRDENGGCDCSAFVCWALGISKHAPFAWMGNVNGGWYNTDGIWWDAMKEPTGYFKRCAPLPGSILVYPSAWMARRHGGATGALHKIGHVGIVTEVRAGEVTGVIHCSSGNFRRFGDAIQVTAPVVFRVPTAITAACTLIE